MDTGRAKNNWFPDINKFSSETTEATNKQGSISLVAGATNRLQLGNNFYTYLTIYHISLSWNMDSKQKA